MNDVRGQCRLQATTPYWRSAVFAARLALMTLAGCGQKAVEPPPVPVVNPALTVRVAEDVKIPPLKFVDITEKAGIRFVHANGASGRKLLPETMGSGVACFDYDNDGLEDILFINSCPWPGYEGNTIPRQVLYRNRGDETFEDVTNSSGLGVTMYGMGVAVGDIDNDGWTDVFITGVGGNKLFHNSAGSDGRRRFVDITERAGVAGLARWPTVKGPDFLKLRDSISFPSSAAFLDYDGDGRLDLFVCEYVNWSPGYDLGQPFQLKGVGRAFGPPTAFEGSQCLLYRNMGAGRFDDVTVRAGIQVLEKEGVGPQARTRSIAKSLGVVICDADDDGHPDIVVANDTVRNFFFHNKGNGTFEELGQLCGVAFAEGRARGAMGIDWGEYRPGRYAVLLANFADEPNTFLRLDNRKQMLFSDVAMAEGIHGPSRLPLKFGAFFFDYDNDGRLDLVTCNGHLEPDISLVQKEQTYEQAAQLFWNSGGRASFVQVSAERSGPDLFKPLVGRGAAYLSIRNDGFPDIVLTANGGPARLLRNDRSSDNNWIRLRLEGDGKTANRSAIGAKISVEAGGKVLNRNVTSGRSYLSQCELPVTFGIGKTAKVDRVIVQWPGKNAGTEEWKDLAVNKTHKLVQGSTRSP